MVMTKTNGLLWLNLIQSSLRKKKSFRSWEKKSSRRRLKKNSISSLMKRKERKTPKGKRRDNIINYKSNKQKPMINVNEKKRKSIKEKFSLKSKWEISKWKTRPKERKLKRRKRISLTIYLYKRLRRKLPNRKERPYKENWNKGKDSSK